jgi:hypothetical protein
MIRTVKDVLSVKRDFELPQRKKPMAMEERIRNLPSKLLLD